MAESAARLPDAVNQVYNNLYVRTVDNDVVSLAVMAAQRRNIGELWFHFATWRNFRFLAAHDSHDTWSKQVPGFTILPCIRWF